MLYIMYYILNNDFLSLTLEVVITLKISDLFPFCMKIIIYF